MYKKLLIACSIRQSNCHNLSDFNLPYLVADIRKSFLSLEHFFLYEYNCFYFLQSIQEQYSKYHLLKSLYQHTFKSTLFIITCLKYLSNKGYFYLFKVFKGRIKSSSTNFLSIVIFISKNFDIHSV